MAPAEERVGGEDMETGCEVHPRTRVGTQSGGTR